MVHIKLSETEYWSLTNALQTARDKFKENAAAHQARRGISVSPPGTYPHSTSPQP